MELTVRKLTPELPEDYLRFFETDAHADNPDEDRCYCVCRCREDHTRPTDFSSPEKRRVVGWYNANDK